MSRIQIYLEMVKKSATYGLGTTARRVVSLALVPVYTRYLTPTDYGILELLDLALYLGVLFLGMRLGDSFLYFYFQSGTEEERQQVLTTTVVAAVIVGGMGLALGWAFAPQWSSLILGDDGYALYVKLIAIQLSVTFPIQVGMTYLQALNKAAIFAAVSLVRVVVAAVITTVLLVKFGLGVEAFLWTNTVIAVVFAAGLTIYAVAPNRAAVRITIFWRLLRYGAPLVAHGIGMMVINWGDRIFLRRSVPLAEIGIYSLAYKIGMAVSHVHQPFETYWRAQVFQLLKLEKGEQIYERTATYLTLILTTVVLCVVLFLDPVMNVLVGPDFRSAGVYVPWIGVVYLVRALGDYLRTIIRVEGRPGREAQVTTISAVVCLAGYALLIPRFHLWGAIAATGICFCCALALSWYQAQRTRPFQFELRRMVLILALAAAVALVFRWFRPDDLWLQIPIALICLASYPVLLVVSRVPNTEERQLVNAAVGALRRRLGAP